MSFDSHSLERLQALGRQLPKSIPTPQEPLHPQQKSNKRLHLIETEENPQTLFRELIRVSSDGTVPPHLISRLKEVEEKQLKQTQTQSSSNAADLSSGLSKSQKLSQEDAEKNLYASFKELLRENDEEI